MGSTPCAASVDINSLTAGPNAFIISLRGMVSRMTAASWASVLMIWGAAIIVLSPGFLEKIGCGLYHGLEPDVARFHAALHPGCQHRSARLGIGQGHPHCHQRAGGLGLEECFNVVVRCRFGQVHPLHMDYPAEWYQLQVFAGQVESSAFAVRPFVADLSARPRFADAHRHRPAVWAE